MGPWRRAGTEPHVASVNDGGHVARRVRKPYGQTETTARKHRRGVTRKPQVRVAGQPQVVARLTAPNQQGNDSHRREGRAHHIHRTATALSKVPSRLTRLPTQCVDARADWRNHWPTPRPVPPESP
jgi:hypothetical protein